MKKSELRQIIKEEITSYEYLHFIDDINRETEAWAEVEGKFVKIYLDGPNDIKKIKKIAQKYSTTFKRVPSEEDVMMYRNMNP